MRLDRLRSGLLAGPMPEAGATTELQRFPQREGPVTPQVSNTIGHGSWIPYEAGSLGKMFGEGQTPPNFTDMMARAQLDKAIREHGPRPEIKSPEMGMELSELSDI